MSHSTIVKNINKLLEKKQWTIHDAEKRMKTTSRPLQNIMRGASKNPTIESLRLISDVFNVEVQDLLIDDSNKSSVNLKLLADSYKKVIKELDVLSHIDITHNTVISIVKEVYDYSVNLKIDNADTNFTKWLIQNNYS